MKIEFNKNLLKRDDQFYVCCSSGVDSIAIAHFLKRGNKNFKIVHFNHKFRLQNELMDVKARQFAEYLSVEIVIKRRVVHENKDLHKGNVEDFARKFRLSAMAELGGTFVTAHHLDDATESYLMNCFNGLPSHKPIQEKTEFPNFTIIHPFLKTRKKCLIEYVYRHSLEKFVVEDETNQNQNIRRNFIRNSVIPIISKHYPGITSVVERQFYNE